MAMRKWIGDDDDYYPQRDWKLRNPCILLELFDGSGNSILVEPKTGSKRDTNNLTVTGKNAQLENSNLPKTQTEQPRLLNTGHGNPFTKPVKTKN